MMLVRANKTRHGAKNEKVYRICLVKVLPIKREGERERRAPNEKANALMPTSPF